MQLQFYHFKHWLGFHWWTDWYRITKVKDIKRGEEKVGETADYRRYCFYPKCKREQTEDMHYCDLKAPERFE